jgi:hypothetical protein
MSTGRASRLRFVFLSLIGVLALLTLHAPAFAATSDATPAFALVPVGESGAYFTETMKAGEVKTLKVDLGDAGTAPVKARTYVADAYTLANGGFGVRADGEPVSGPTLWIDYPAQTLDLEPGKLIERSFTVTVPKDAKPGQYLAGLVIQTAEPVPVNGSAMFKQTILKSIAVFITVPGPVTPGFTIGKASVIAHGATRMLSIALTNTGNVLVKPEGSITLANAAGATVVTVPVSMGSVYAGTSTTIEIAVSDSLAAGDYALSIDLSDKATGAKAKSAGPLAVPDASVATPVANPVTIDAFTLDPARDAAGHLKYVSVDVKIGNTGDAIANSRLTLHVTLDGKPVEDFVMSASLAVPRGVTDVPARYLPAGDWASGQYGFSVTLDAVDPGTGQSTTLVTVNAPETVTGP